MPNTPGERRRPIIVTLAGARAVDAPEVLDLLRATGMEVTSVLTAARTVLGRSDEAAIDRLRAVPGVRVTPDEVVVRLPPPDRPQ